MTVNPFDDLMLMLDTPVFVLTAQVDGKPAGCPVAFATQTSVQPPSFMVGFPLDHPMNEVGVTAEYMAVQVLPQRCKVLAELFIRHNADGSAAFAHCAWRGGPGELPILDDAAGWFVGRIASRSAVGDHAAYLLEPVAAWASEAVEDLLYLSDLDEDIGNGRNQEEQQQRLYQAGRPAATDRTAMRFTLDVP